MKLLPSIYWLAPLLLYISTSPLVLAEDAATTAKPPPTGDIECNRGVSGGAMSIEKGSACFSTVNVGANCKENGELLITYAAYKDKEEKEAVRIVNPPDSEKQIQVKCYCKEENCNNVDSFKDQLIIHTKQEKDLNENFNRTFACIIGDTVENILNPTTTTAQAPPPKPDNSNNNGTDSNATASNDKTLYIYVGIAIVIVALLVLAGFITYFVIKRGKKEAEPAKDGKKKAVAESKTPRATTVTTTTAQTPKTVKDVSLSPPVKQQSEDEIAKLSSFRGALRFGDPTPLDSEMAGGASTLAPSRDRLSTVKKKA